MSKELEALNKIKKDLTRYDDLDNVRGIDDEEELNLIETALKKYNVLQEVHKDFVDKNIKKLKALDIIKNKKVDLAYFYRLQPRNDVSDNQKFKYINQYNEYGKKLTRKEYDLLKEILL